MTAVRSLVALLTVSALAACAGVAEYRPPAGQVQPQTLARSAGPAAMQCLTTTCIYVTDPTEHNLPRVAGSVFIYPADATGDIRFVAKIAGSHTHLGHPSGIAVDAQHDVYVSNTRSVTIYAPGAYGNVVPARMIAGSNTTLFNAKGIAVDGAGNVYVSQRAYHSRRSNIAVFGPGANGNDAPIRTIRGNRTNLKDPEPLALDGAGNLYVGNSSDCCDGYVTVYRAGAHGDVRPLRTIKGKATQMLETQGIAVDDAANIYVSDLLGVDQGSGYITVYASGAEGEAAPIRRIDGLNTGIHVPVGLALDASGNIYLADKYGPFDRGSVLVFGAGANGDVAPRQLISGPHTALTTVHAIAVR